MFVQNYRRQDKVNAVEDIIGRIGIQRYNRKDVFVFLIQEKNKKNRYNYETHCLYPSILCRAFGFGTESGCEDECIV